MTQIAHRPIGELVVNLDRRRVPVKASDRREGPYPYYGASGVVDHVDDYLFEGLHLLVAEDGENLRSRNTPVAFLADGRFWVNNHAHVLQGNSENDTRYLSYALEAADISGYVTGSAQPKLSQAALAAIEVPAPPLDVQRAIAATLGALDDKIESNRRAIELMVEVVRGRFAGDFDVDQADDGVAIGELVDINSRRRLARGEEATYVGMSSLPEFSPAVLDWEKRAFGSGQKFVNGDVLMARITPCLENGKTAVVDMLRDGEVGWGSTEYVVLSPRGAFSTPWIYALTRHETIREWAISRMTGTSGRQRFQASGFDEYRIQEPDPAVLAAFNDFAVPMLRKVSQARDEIKLLEKLRDALLPELLSGRMRVPAEGVAA